VSLAVFTLFALATLSTGQDPASYARNKRGKNRRGGAQGNKRCRIAGCARCSKSDKNVCESCRPGFGLVEGQCRSCSVGCKSCSFEGTETCHSCKQSFTFSPINQTCQPCAPHCLQCDEAGPGGCNECGKRRMLHVHLELEGEIHECLPCPSGCRACDIDHGCTICDPLHTALPDGAGCVVPWMRISLVVIAVILAFCGCVYAVGLDDDVDGAHRAHRTVDRAEVVQHDEGADLRRRGGGRGVRMEQSPPRERGQGAYPLLQGYSGIEIVD